MINLPKIIFIFLLLTISLSTQAQILDKISIEPTIGTEMALARLIPQVILEQGNRPEPSTTSIDGGWALLGGGYLKFRLNERWQIKTGVLFQLEHFDYTLDGLVFGSDIDPSRGGYISTSTLKGAMGLHRWNIPLLLDYYWQKDTYHFSIGFNRRATKRDFIHSKVVYLGNGSVEGGRLEPTKVEEPYTHSLGAVLGIGRKFCFQSPHPALLIRVLGHYHLGEPILMASFNKGRRSPSFALEVGYEF